jgi:hypothetical protein
MRLFARCAAAGLIAGAVAFPRPLAAQGQPAGSKDPATILAAARQALGGEKKLGAVKSFTATGRTRQVRGDNLVPIEFEIFVELPDKYVRKDEIPAQESGPTASGFNGDDLLVDPPPPAAMPEPMKKARVSTLKQDFARLALGMFAGSYPSYPLTFTYAGQAEAPQGKADVLDAKGPDGVTLRYFISVDTHLPIMVSWQPPAPPARPAGPGRGPAAPGAPAAPGGAPAGAPPAGPPPAGPPPAGAMPPPAGVPPATPPAATPPAGAPPQGAAPGATPPAGMPQRGAVPGGPRPEFRVYFADYRDVDGMQFPFRIRRATGADTTEETTFDRFRINPKIDPKKFEVRK